MLRTLFDHSFSLPPPPPPVSREHKSQLLQVSSCLDEDLFSRAWFILPPHFSRLPGLQVAKERPLRDARAYSGQFLLKFSALWLPTLPPIRSAYCGSACISIAGVSRPPSLSPLLDLVSSGPSTSLCESLPPMEVRLSR